MTTTQPTGPPADAGEQARIYEQGYRAYTGDRTGVPGAMRTVITTSIRSVLGLGRSGRHKIMPVVVIALAYVPAVVFIGLAALLPSDIEESFLPSYAEYYGFTSTALLLFSAFVAPELLCSDRRTGMLGVYLSSPLTRQTYLAAKTLAISIILTIVTIGPPLLLLIALSLEDAGPDGWGAGLTLAYRIIVSGIVLSAVYAAVSMAVSATTERKGIATATTLGLLVTSTVVTNLLIEETGVSPWLHLADLPTLPLELAFRIHGERGEWGTTEVSTPLLWLAFVVIVGGSAAWIWNSYRRMLVQK